MKHSFKIEKTISEEITLDLPAYREYAGSQVKILDPHRYIRVENFESGSEHNPTYYLRGMEIAVKQNYDANVALMATGKPSTEAAFNNAYQRALSFLQQSIQIPAEPEKYISSDDLNTILKSWDEKVPSLSEEIELKRMKDFLEFEEPMLGRDPMQIIDPLP